MANRGLLAACCGKLMVEAFDGRFDSTLVGDPYLEEAIDHVWMERR